MIGPLGRVRLAATLGQHCTQLTRRPGAYAARSHRGFGPCRNAKPSEDRCLQAIKLLSFKGISVVHLSLLGLTRRCYSPPERPRVRRRSILPPAPAVGGQLFLPPPPLIAIEERGTGTGFGHRHTGHIGNSRGERRQGQASHYSPGYDDDEVHDVPGVAEVAALVADEPVGQDLHRHLHREDAHEHRLQLLLQ